MNDADAPILPVILSGGSGTRLWPLSTRAHPKQFHALVGDLPMIAATAERVAARDLFAAPYAIGSVTHEKLLRDSLAVYRPAAMILEPVARNTAAAIAVAALVAEGRGQAEAPMLVLPSDHAITDIDAFVANALIAASMAQAGHLVTFGIVPASPHTGYGYIRRGAPVVAAAGISRIDRFVEKPALEVAQAMLAEGGYSWNSGMFCFTARAVLEEFARHAPDILEAARVAVNASAWQGDVLRLDEATFAAIPAQAFDVAIMEKTDRAVVVEAKFDWNDVGSWPSLHDVIDHDARGNHVRGEHVALADDALNCYVRNETSLPVFVSGLDDVSIVVTENGIVVTSRNSAQYVRQAAGLFDGK